MSIIDDIKANLNIVSVIQGQGVALEKKGANYVGLCCFHDEQTPSFVVSESKQHWHCFGACATGGDLIDFVMKRQGLVTVTDAIKALAPLAGIELQSSNQDQYDRLYTLLAETSLYYQDVLRNAPKAAAARVYMIKTRGFSTDTLLNWRIGYANGHLVSHLMSKGYAFDEMIAAGVAQIRDDGTGMKTVIDRFWDRVMIPVTDTAGRVVGFGGRRLGENGPKYLNSPTTALFNKGSLLFGLSQAAVQIKGNAAVVVEGYFDVLRAHECGYAYVVGSMGTALTEQQIKQLSRHTFNIILAFDSDKAGSTAALKAISRALPLAAADKHSLNLGVMITSGKDTDETLKADPAAWYPEQALDAVDYLIDAAVKTLPEKATLRDKQAALASLYPVLTDYGNPLVIADNTEKLARAFELNELALAELVNQRQTKQDDPKDTPQSTERAAFERLFLAGLFANLSNVSRLRRQQRFLVDKPLWDSFILLASDFTDWQARTCFDAINHAFDSSDLDRNYDQIVLDFLPAELSELPSRTSTASLETLVNQALRIKLNSLIDNASLLSRTRAQAKAYSLNMNMQNIISAALHVERA